MKYNFQILNLDDGKETKVEAMSFKKALKSILITQPKFNGTLCYINKKGREVIHSIVKGKKINLYLIKDNV
jgi:hypothetical protein